MAPRLILPFVAVVAAGLGSACGSEPTERPPGLNGEPSGPIDSVGGDGDGEGGEAGDGDTPLSGTLAQYDDDSFETMAAYSQSAEVYVIAADGLSHETFEAPGGAFTLSGLEVGDKRWMAVNPTGNPGMQLTVTQQTIGEEALTLPLVSTPLLEEISQSVISENAAQIVLVVVDTQGEPIPGVQVSFVSGGGDITYENGGGWFDSLDQTSESGLIFIANSAAAPLPGTTIEVFFAGAIDGEASVRGINGAVTVMTHVVGP